MKKDIYDLVEKGRAIQMSSEQLEEQRIGFAYGNAPDSDRNTRESIRNIAEAGRHLLQPESQGI